MRQRVREAIEEYNRYRSPEAAARLIAMNADAFQIEFTGSFCHTCGFYDYFDDYQLLLEERGVKTEIVEVTEHEEGAVVAFRALKEGEHRAHDTGLSEEPSPSEGGGVQV